MEFLFLTEAGAYFGIGHMMRCRAVAQALREFGRESLFIVHGEPAPQDDIIYADYNWKKDTFRLIEDIAAMGEGLKGIFVDSYYVPVSLFDQLTVFKVPVFILDDQYLYSNCSGIIVNPDLAATASDYALHDKTSVYTGARYAPLRRAFWEVENKPYLQRNGILVTFGGSDISDLQARVVDSLRNSKEKVTVLGPTGNETDFSQPTFLDGFADEIQMVDHICSARLIICGGGGTLLEAARCGTPAITLKIAENQTSNIKLMSALGFAFYAGDRTSPDTISKIPEYLDQLKDHTCWRRANQAGISLVDGQGARRIAALMEKAFHGREQREMLKKSYIYGNLELRNYLDCDSSEHLNIVEARNHQDVRAGSAHSRIITPDIHQAFLMTLRTSSTQGYWRVYKNGKILGTLSLSGVNYEEGTSVLGYYKDFRCLENRVGRTLVRAAVDLAFNTLSLTKVEAECYDSNIASIKSMEAVGFMMIGLEDRTVEGKRLKIRHYEKLRSKDKV